MLIALLLLQIVVLIAVAALFLRKPTAPEADPRLAQLAETLPAQLTRLDTYLDAYLREALTQMRSDIPAEASRTRKDNEAAAAALRNEVIGNITTLGNTLKTELAKFGENSTASAERLRGDVEQKMRSISQSFGELKEETSRKHAALQESLSTRLIGLMDSNSAHQDKLRSTVEERLNKLNTDNSAKLEEMRATVDEKLHATLNTRLTESFSQVTDQLTKVHTGLGEMSKLSEGVDGLSRIFTNVKSRGGMAEVLLGQLISQTLAPSQFVHNAQVKPGTQEVVEYAVKFPGTTGETLLPIDAKFPREDWERLETAYETGIPEEIAVAGRAFETAIRTEGKRIFSKYINEPVTTPYGIMFLPTESLYAEVIRRDGLQDDLQRNYRVTIAGPSTLSAILISFKMGFHMLNLQKKGDDVWKVLASTRTEFEKFGDLMTSMEKQVGTVQNTIQKLGVRTRAINRNLRDVGETDAIEDNVLSFDGIAPRLVASGEEE
ncbi:DNA recombination protein RmuC [Granulicella sp. WH15]|uniref:DNA recombination protein RmuC n=1 Tax=Granulicella sp. WH15 TaxID=2602070 RepID=UPI00136757F6|nr:DNA recombination protein RmuC [Granulicella sp. WH15]QHN02456.1 DNA recombination protein RmuC [Granulicella sp. WH15]